MTKYILYLDNRENALIEKFRDNIIKNFTIKVCALKVGDIIIALDNHETEEDIYKNTVLIFERKTCSDLLSSINDGRYREQKSRLISNFKKNQICYIIENDISINLNKYKTFGRQIVIGALVNKCFRDNIKTLKTKSIDETCDFLNNICKKVVSNPEFFQSSEETVSTTNLEESNSTNVDSYSANIKIAKKDNITPERFSVLSLTIIPGISAKIASTIINEYKGLPNLIMEINNLRDDEEKKHFFKKISDIQLDISGGKKRRIGIKIAEKLNEYLSLFK